MASSASASSTTPASSAAAGHPVEHTWAFWEIREGNNKKDYSSNVRLLGDFSTVEKFWEYWATIPSPSEIFSDATKKVFVDEREIKALGLFKKGITPEWEDPENRDGCQLEAFKHLSAEAMNIHWENLVFGLIGERIDENDNICGVRLVNQNKKGKANCKFEIWLKRKDADAANRVKANLLEALGEGNDRVKPTFKMTDADFTQNNRGY